MLLAIDIGNSSIKFGVFDGSRLFSKFSIQTKKDYIVDELLFDRLKIAEREFIQVDVNEIIIASVVPDLNAVFADACLRLFATKPAFVDHTFDLGIAVMYEPPQSAGIDRLINASAAAARYGAPAIVCSFGTATTIDVVNAEKEFIGGVIYPGMAAMAAVLNTNTAQLPVARIAKPDTLIGNSTELAIRSGIYYASVRSAEGLIQMYRDVLGDDVPVVATGGFSAMIAEDCPSIGIVEENLTLEGLRLVAERRR